MTRYIPRSEWNDLGNSPAGYGMGTVSQVVFHHTPGQDPDGNYLAALKEVRQIRNGHIYGNGWSDIGYTFLVSGDMVFEGRGFGRSGAHAPGANSSSIGIAFILDGRNRPPTQAEWEAARWIIDQAIAQGYLTANFTAYGHRDFVATECPAAQVYGNINTIYNVQAGSGGVIGGDEMGAHETAMLESLVNQINIPGTGWKFDDGTPIRTLPEFLSFLMARQDRTLSAIRASADVMAQAAQQDLNIESTGWKKPDGSPVSTLPEFIHVNTMSTHQKIDELIAVIHQLVNTVRNVPQQVASATPSAPSASIDPDDLADRIIDRARRKVGLPPL